MEAIFDFKIIAVTLNGKMRLLLARTALTLQDFYSKLTA